MKHNNNNIQELIMLMV